MNMDGNHSILQLIWYIMMHKSRDKQGNEFRRIVCDQSGFYPEEDGDMKYNVFIWNFSKITIASE